MWETDLGAGTLQKGWWRSQVAKCYAQTPLPVGQVVVAAELSTAKEWLPQHLPPRPTTSIARPCLSLRALNKTLMCFLPSPPNLNSVICNTATSGSHIYKIAEKKPNPPKHRDQLQKSIQSKFCKGHEINHTRRCFSLVDNILRHNFGHNPHTLRNFFFDEAPAPAWCFQHQTNCKFAIAGVARDESGSNTVGRHLSGTLYFTVSWPRLCTHTKWSVHVQPFYTVSIRIWILNFWYWHFLIIFKEDNSVHCFFSIFISFSLLLSSSKEKMTNVYNYFWAPFFSIV